MFWKPRSEIAVYGSNIEHFLNQLFFSLFILWAKSQAYWSLISASHILVARSFLSFLSFVSFWRATCVRGNFISQFFNYFCSLSHYLQISFADSPDKSSRTKSKAASGYFHTILASLSNAWLEYMRVFNSISFCVPVILTSQFSHTISSAHEVTSELSCILWVEVVFKVSRVIWWTISKLEVWVVLFDFNFRMNHCAWKLDIFLHLFASFAFGTLEDKEMPKLHLEAQVFGAWWYPYAIVASRLSAALFFIPGVPSAPNSNIRAKEMHVISVGTLLDMEHINTRIKKMRFVKKMQVIFSFSSITRYSVITVWLTRCLFDMVCKWLSRPLDPALLIASAPCGDLVDAQ